MPCARNQLPLAIASLFSVSAGVACGPSEEAFANAVVTSALQAPHSQQVVDDVLDDRCSAVTAEAAAAEAAQRPSIMLYPSSCVEKRAEGTNLHVTLHECTGLFGRVELNGELDARFQAAGECRLRAVVADRGNLTANARSFAYQASADIEVLEGAHDIAWNARWSGTTRRGREIEQVSSLRVLLDRTSYCRNVDGEATGHVGRFDYDWQVEGMSLCPGECPTSGVVHAGFQGRGRERNLRVEFDGSRQAHVTGWSGKQFDVPMLCETGEVEADD